MRTLTLLPLLAALGCGPSHPFDLAPVSGTVTLDGEPLAGARVTFQPTDAALATCPGSDGVTDAAGRYTLKVVSLGSPGAVVGPHRVEVNRPLPELQKGDDGPIPDKVPAKFNARSKLTFDVPRGGTAAADFHLTTK